MRSEAILQWVVGPDVLDVGCAGHIPKPGSPYWLHGRLREQHPAVVGIDINEENIRLLRELGYQNIIVASAEEFSLGRRFDTIVAGELIEHLSNPGLFLARCREHLKPGGRLVLSTPYAFSLSNILYALLKYPNTCQNDEHTGWFCVKTLRELSARYGFQVAHWELLEDYDFTNPSVPYKVFARLVTTIGRFLLPARLRNNTMLFVLAAAG